MVKHKKKSKSHKEKKHKKDKKKKHHSSSDSSSTSEDEWVEKSDSPPPPKSTSKDNPPKFQKPNDREDWMNITSIPGLFSHREVKKQNDEQKKLEKQSSQYDPKTCVRELNPYWKDGGDGLPSATKTMTTKFMKPSDDYDYKKYSTKSRSSNWRKKSPERERQNDREESRRRSPERERRNDDYRRDREESRKKSPDRRNDNYRRNDRDETRRKSPDIERRHDDYRRNDRDESRRKSPEREKRYEDCRSNDRDGSRRKSPERDRGDFREIIREVPTSSKTTDIIYETEEMSPEHESVEEEIDNDYLTDKEMNELAAKIVKAEILGNTSRVTELKEKLEKAQIARDNPSNASRRLQKEDEEVLLTRTTSKGFSRPLNEPTVDPYDKKGKRKPVNTHDSGKRQKYYPDDEKHSLQNMFENEKYGTNDKQDEEFMKAASRLAKADDLEDMFMDNIRVKDSDEKAIRRERDRAIREHQIMTQTLDNCVHCVQSSAMLKHLMVSLGETAFLSLPQHDPPTDGTCYILPIRHVSCSTQLDENEWSEILELRKSLTNMFHNQRKTVIFYETAINLNRHPHMLIHCVPVPQEQGDVAPIYFKKAIDECEMEWSTNKKLINMAGKDVRRCVPKGLPYFWVSFGMKEGFAHVIEEQKYFPKFFAEEIFGGILDLHHSKWRKASAQKFELQKARVMEFSKKWKEFDCTSK